MFLEYSRRKLSVTSFSPTFKEKCTKGKGCRGDAQPKNCPWKPINAKRKDKRSNKYISITPILYDSICPTNLATIK